MVIGRTAASPAGLARATRERFATEIDGGIVSLAATVQGRLATVAAANAGPQPIASGRTVKVIQLLTGNTLLVEAL